jgi:hypothetical protein
VAPTIVLVVLGVEPGTDVVVELPTIVVVVVVVVVDPAAVVVVVDTGLVVVVVGGEGAVVVVTGGAMDAAISMLSKWMYPFAADPWPSKRIVVAEDIQAATSIVSDCCFCDPLRGSVVRVVQDAPPLAEIWMAMLPETWP